MTEIREDGTRIAYLQCVTSENNNKYYILDEKAGTYEFEVRYGRVGGHETVKTYSMYDWDRVYRDRTRPSKKPMPYTDITHLMVELANKSAGNDNATAKISDAEIATLIRKLQALANKSISNNYTVVASSVTQAQVDTAQSILNEIASLIKEENFHRIDALLLEAYTVIPRRMDHVQDYLLGNRLTHTRAIEILTEEQDNLDVMSQQVLAHASTPASSAGDASDESILDQMGIEIISLTREEIGTNIRPLTQEYGNNILKAYQVVNKAAQVSFDQHLSEIAKENTGRTGIELLWHGSRSENWLSILQQSLRVRPTGAARSGSMFGNGIYFSSVFKKSRGYTSVRDAYWRGQGLSTGWMALFQVHTGNKFVINRHGNWCYDLDVSALKKHGDYDSVYAPKGYDLINPETVVYRPVQVTIKYLVEVN